MGGSFMDKEETPHYITLRKEDLTDHAVDLGIWEALSNGHEDAEEIEIRFTIVKIY